MNNWFQELFFSFFFFDYIQLLVVSLVIWQSFWFVSGRKKKELVGGEGDLTSGKSLSCLFCHKEHIHSHSWDSWQPQSSSSVQAMLWLPHGRSIIMRWWLCNANWEAKMRFRQCWIWRVWYRDAIFVLPCSWGSKAVSFWGAGFVKKCCHSLSK